jgi:hypothetical protein
VRRSVLFPLFAYPLRTKRFQGSKSETSSKFSFVVHRHPISNLDNPNPVVPHTSSIEDKGHLVANVADARPIVFRAGPAHHPARSWTRNGSTPDHVRRAHHRKSGFFRCPAFSQLRKCPNVASGPLTSRLESNPSTSRLNGRLISELTTSTQEFSTIELIIAKNVPIQSPPDQRVELWITHLLDRRHRAIESISSWLSLGYRPINF